MSHFGAPALTAMATPEPASVTSEPDKTFPCLSKLSMPARLRIKTSARLAGFDACDQHRGSTPGDGEAAAVLSFEVSEQFLCSAVHANAAVNAQLGHD